MNDNSEDGLDRLLGDWATSQQADEQHTNRLARQILAAARDETGVDRNKSAQLRHEPDFSTLPEPRKALVRPTEDWGGRLMIGGGGLLLMLALAGCLLYYNLTTVSPGTPPRVSPIASSNNLLPATTAANDTPAAASLDATALAAKQRLLTETNELFDNQLAWIADGQREVAFEIGQRAALEAGEFMLVRVVVAQRTSPDSPWSTIWQTDVISRSEAMIEISPKQLDGSSLALWTYQMSDGAVAVDMDLVLGQQTRRQSSSSAVLQAGRPTRVGCSIENGIEQCVFQTVMPLDPSHI